MTDQVTHSSTGPHGPVASDGPEQPPVGVAELHRHIGGALAAAFPSRLWLCGEIVGAPVVRRNDAGIAFSLAEPQGSTLATVRAWLGRPYYQQLRQDLGDTAIAALLTVGNLVVVGGQLQYDGRFNSLELRVDRVVPTPAGDGTVSQQRAALHDELAASGALARQRTFTRLPLAPRRVGIVTGAAGTAGYDDAVAVLEQSNFHLDVRHYPAPLEGPHAPARIAAQIRAASVANQTVLVVRGGGEHTQLSVFDSAPVVTAIVMAPVPVITGIGHSHNATLADEAAHQVCASPAHAATIIVDQLQNAQRNLQQMREGIYRAAKTRLAGQHAARRRLLGLGVALACLVGVAAWRGAWSAAAMLFSLLAVAALATLARRHRPAVSTMASPPTANTFEEVIQELGAVETALHHAATRQEIRWLVNAAASLGHRGAQLLGSSEPQEP
jgi:exodeoxyribonuclease VII large subunit